MKANTQDAGGPDLRNRLALSIAEAAKVVGLSENAFRRVLPEIERIYVGRRVLVPVAAIEAWLRAGASRDEIQSDSVLDDLMKDLG